MFFPYDFDNTAKLLLRPIGVRCDRDGVRLDNDRLTATFGPLNLNVETSNIEKVSVGGPYKWIKAIGPRISLGDHGLTFGTTASAGVCIEFCDPIPAVFGPWKHPGVTLTVADPHEFVTAVRRLS